METVPNTFPDLFVGYAVLWTVLVLYIWSLGTRFKTLQKNFEDKQAEK